MNYKDFESFTVSDPVVINNKDGKPIWDLYTLVMQNGAIRKTVRLITEHNGIDLKNTSSEVQRNFFITRLFGQNGLFEKQGRNDFIFLGRLDYKDGKYKPSRFYSVPYSNLDAQTYFDRNYQVLETFLSQQELNDEKRKELEKRKSIEARIKKYGFNMDEYDALMRNISSDYFISTTLLHEFDILKLNKLPIGNPLQYIDFWTDFNNVTKFYENVYSAMCKFALIYNQDISVKRQCSRLYKKEMEATGKTASLLSFSPISNVQTVYSKPDEIALEGIIRRGTPCFDYSIFNEDNWQPNPYILEEILIPPFMNITYNNKLYDNHNWSVDINYKMSQNFTEEDARTMTMLELQIKDMSVVRRYYKYWDDYITGRSKVPNDNLRREFRTWQINFKKYLQLKYKKIENEVMRSYNATISPNAVNRATNGISPVDASQAIKNFISKLKNRGTKNGPKL